MHNTGYATHVDCVTLVRLRVQVKHNLHAVQHSIVSRQSYKFAKCIVNRWSKQALMMFRMAEALVVRRRNPPPGT
jgi:hypothetical protein